MGFFLNAKAQSILKTKNYALDYFSGPTISQLYHPITHKSLVIMTENNTNQLRSFGNVHKINVYLFI